MFALGSIITASKYFCLIGHSYCLLKEKTLKIDSEIFILSFDPYLFEKSDNALYDKGFTLSGKRTARF